MAKYITATISWKTVTLLPTDPPIHESTLLFKVLSSTGLHSRLGIDTAFAYIPYALEPSTVFHQLLRNKLANDKATIDGLKFPYRIQLTDLVSGTLNESIRLYPPNLLVLTTSFSHFTAPDLSDTDFYIWLQRLSSHRLFKNITKFTVDAVAILDHKRVIDCPAKLETKPLLYLLGRELAPRSAEFYHLQKQCVRILIRAGNNLSDEVVDNVLSKNKEHNLKDPTSPLFIDKQGLLYVDTTSGYHNYFKYKRAADLYELGLVCRTFLRDFHNILSSNEDFAEFLLYRIRSWVNEPNLVFAASVATRKAWTLILTELGLASYSGRIMARSGIADRLTKKERTFDQFAHTWWKYPDFAYRLSREVHDSQGAGLGFIEDPELARLIASDYLEASRALENKGYKSAVLLFGSIVEALLADLMIRHNVGGYSRDQIYNFTLDKLITSLKSTKLIKDDTLFDLLTPVRKYRNLIHPGVQLRKEVSADEEKAKIAVHVVDLLTRELARTA